MDYSRPKLNLYADLAVLASSYGSGRLTREEFVEAAVALGLPRDQALGRVLGYDANPRPFPVTT